MTITPEQFDALKPGDEALVRIKVWAKSPSEIVPTRLTFDCCDIHSIFPPWLPVPLKVGDWAKKRELLGRIELIRGEEACLITKDCLLFLARLSDLTRIPEPGK